jgi:hypothetical protein
MLAPTPEFNQESDFTLAKIRPQGYPIMGTAADWLEKLDFWNRALGGIDWFILRIRIPLGPAAEKVMECIQRIGEEVLPNYRK